MDIMKALEIVITAIKTWADENKVQKVNGKGLSSNDYTTADKNKVENIANDLVILDGKLYLAQDGTPLTDSAVLLPKDIGGDMLKAVYDMDGDDIVDNAARLEGHSASYFATANDLNTLVGNDKVSVQIAEAIANKAEVGHNHDGDYDTKGVADTALTNAKAYVDAEIIEWVGDKKVSEQITVAIANKASTPKLTSVDILASNWVGESSPWSQVVNISGITSNSKVDLQPTAVQIVSLQDSETALMLQNNEGVVTAWAVGNKPVQDYSMQALITEVAYV
jgi:hypothetical protein